MTARTTPATTAPPVVAAPAVPVSRRALGIAMAAAALVTVVVALLAGGIRATHGNQTSGDEPHYLLTAASLGIDGNLDVSDQVDAQAYRPYHEQALAPQAATEPSGREVVPHDPGLPVVLAGPMRLGGWRAAKAVLAVVAGLLAAASVWLAVRRFGATPWPGALVVGLLCATAPVVVYGAQVYPEIVAALVVVGGVAAASGPAGWRGDAGTLLAVVVLPWLAVKYVPVAAALGAVHLVRRWRTGHRAAVGWSVAVLAVAGMVYLAAHLAWYGGVTVYAAGDFFRTNGSQLSVVGTRPDHVARAARLVGLWVDRDFGIATWQPAWLLGVGGMAWLVRRRQPHGAMVVGVVAAGWLTATFVALTMQGWWFPGRQVVVVLPLVAVGIASWAAQRPPVAATAVGLGLAGAVTTGWLLVDGLAERLTLIVDFALVGSPVFAFARVVVPDYRAATGATWVAHVAWIMALLAVGWWGWRDAAAASMDAPSSTGRPAAPLEDGTLDPDADAILVHPAG